MTFEEADKLCDEITEFLLECGGVYDRVTVELQLAIMESLALNQYILFRDSDGKIEHFLIYWKVDRSVVESLGEYVKPKNITTGDTLYIMEHGNKAGRKSLTKMIRELRVRAGDIKGVCWNNKGRGIKLFANQKGIYAP